MCSDPPAEYAFGSTKSEHERLIRQAAVLAPISERVFREAGIKGGHRVLELGSGVGDVAMLVARMVGESGAVVGIERDSASITVARTRTLQAGLRNLRFIESDVASIASAERFDAAVGRFILEFVPDPVIVLGQLKRLVRPGGVVAFHEISWLPTLKLIEGLPLLAEMAKRSHEILVRSGANTNIGLDLPRVFRDAGYSPPELRMEIMLEAGPIVVDLWYDLFESLRPLGVRLGVPFASLGDLQTLRERLRVEAGGTSRAIATAYSMVGAWTRV